MKKILADFSISKKMPGAEKVPGIFLRFKISPAA